MTTLVDHRPDFLPTQLQSFKNGIIGDFDFIPLNNAFSSERRTRNKSQLSELGLASEQVTRDFVLEFSQLRPAFKRGAYIDPAMACAYGMDWFWKNILPDSKNTELLFIDSDMFLIDSFDVRTVLNGATFAAIPQYRGAVSYPYAGIFIGDLQLEDLSQIRWYPGRFQGENCDVGGKSFKWFQSRLGTQTYRELIMLSVKNAEMGRDATVIESQINGNFNFTFLKSHRGSEVKVLSHDPFDDIKPFWRKGDVSAQLSSLARQVASEFEKASGFQWPTPLYFDFVGVRNDESFHPFVFHYKSGSNYQPWATPAYNEKKTRALTNLMMNTGRI